MSACVLLNLLKKLRKWDKMQGLLSILLPFHELYRFNKSRAGGMLDSIYLNYFVIPFWCENLKNFAKYM